MKQFKFFVCLLIILFCFVIPDVVAQKKAIIKFGLIADIQYGDLEDRGNRYYRSSLEKLDSCVADLNRAKVQFSVNLGDLVDRKPTDLDLVLAILNKLENKVYNITGNHDYVEITNNQRLYKKLSMPNEYYAIDLLNWKFIFLNTNEIASYSNVKGTWKQRELDSILNSLNLEKRKNSASYNGGISSKQFDWLKEQFENVKKEKRNVIIFSHHPFSPDNGYSALNDRALLSLIGNYNLFVKAVISGHHHEGAFATFNGIPFITTEGMVETKDQNAYGLVEIYDNELILIGKGRTKSYKFAIN